jgi:ribonuclease P protein component
LNVTTLNLVQSEFNENTSPRFKYTKHQRLLNSKEFKEVFDDAPIRASHPQFLILARINQLGYARLGLVVAKKNARFAHQRNSIKRVARETFRQHQHQLPAVDAIVLSRKGADLVPKDQLTSIFTGLWKRISKRAPQATP